MKATKASKTAFPLDERFVAAVKAGDFPARRLAWRVTPEEAGLLPHEAIDLFETQVMSRRVDFVARELRARGEGFYTIGSSGHEGMAAVAKASRATDMAFLHYRDAAFFIQRAKSVPGTPVLYDLMLSLAASAEDPISGGRHKVLGSRKLSIPPQTSTIASQLPKAVGAALSVCRARDLKLDGAPMPGDGVVYCNFGDASINHSTAVGAINSAAWTAYQGIPLPLIFVCEDNGIGISVRTPGGWVRENGARRPGLRYIECDGLDIADTFRAASEAEHYARVHRHPVLLHVNTVRLLGHAGSDVETVYRTKTEIEAAERQDPLLHTARILIESGAIDAGGILRIYEDVRQRAAHVAEKAIVRPRMKTVEEVQASIVPERVRSAPAVPDASRRRETLGTDLKRMEQPQPMSRLLNWALGDLMLRYPNTLVFGEDVARKGGVYGVTQGLQQKFGQKRVFDTLLDEQSILGTAIGMAHNGFVPIPEIQFLAYVHNAEDQIRGEAATLSFFSNGQYTNPMVIRIAGLAYQKGFGGHFHNDNSLAVFRDLPGVIIACPSHGEDAVRMLRRCVRAAYEEQRVVVFVEPIALYPMRDLHEEGDQGWLGTYPQPTGDPASDEIEPGEFAVHGEGTDLCIVTYGNGTYLSRRAAHILERENGVRARVVDLRWIAPLDEEALAREASRCDSVLIVDECRRTGSQSEALMAAMVEQGVRGPLRRHTADDCFIPLGDAATLPLPSVESIVREALETVPSRSRAKEAIHEPRA